MNVNPTIWGTVSLLELIWTTASVIGALYTFYNERVAEQYYQAAVAPPLDVVAVEVALLDRFIQRLIALVLAGCMVAGVINSLSPPPIVRAVVTGTGWSTLVLLMAVPILLAYLSFEVNRRRKLIFNLRVDADTRDAADTPGMEKAESDGT